MQLIAGTNTRNSDHRVREKEPFHNVAASPSPVDDSPLATVFLYADDLSMSSSVVQSTADTTPRQLRLQPSLCNDTLSADIIESEECTSAQPTEENALRHPMSESGECAPPPSYISSSSSESSSLLQSHSSSDWSSICSSTSSESDVSSCSSNSSLIIIEHGQKKRSCDKVLLSTCICEKNDKGDKALVRDDDMSAASREEEVFILQGSQTPSFQKTCIATQVQRRKTSSLKRKGNDQYKAPAAKTDPREPAEGAKQKRRIESNRSMSKGKQGSLLSVFRRLVLFEINYTMPAMMTMILYCVAHISIYELISVIVQDNTFDFNNQAEVHVALLLGALAVMRFSGGIWIWLNDNEFERVKRAMKKKLRFGHWDIRILQWVKKHPILLLAGNVITLYTCFLVTDFFLNCKMIPLFFDQKERVLDGLPSMKFPEISTHIKHALSNGETIFEEATTTVNGNVPYDFIGPDGNHYNYATILNWRKLEEIKANLTAEDGMYLEDLTSTVSYYKIVGDPGAPVYSYESAMLFYLTTSILSIFALSKIGVGFWSR